MSGHRPPVVELSGVSRTFAGTPPVEALRSVDLVIEAGDYLAIVGPSGSGKSTMLHLLGLLDSPTEGSYRLDGVDTADLDERERAALRGSSIGFVFQAFHLLATRSNLENVMLAETYAGGPRSGRRERALAALDRVGLAHLADRSPAELSGGERQRVAIARALVASPSLILADEPTGNLDTANSLNVLDVFDELHAAGATLAIITHDLDVAARAQRRVAILDGRLQ
ncbi:MAG: ABC transporter ATP-binding protein [Acidimicrobiales bacterium]